MGITDREVHDAIKLGIAKRDSLVERANNVKPHSLDLLDASTGSMEECLASLKNLKADIDWLEDHIETHTVKPGSLEVDLRAAIAGLDL